MEYLLYTGSMTMLLLLSQILDQNEMEVLVESQSLSFDLFNCFNDFCQNAGI